jgi:hypothetical protein
MKKLLIGSIIVVLGLLIAGFATPIFAHGPDGDGATSSDDEVWEAMHEACESGDWEAMAEAAEEVHGDSFEYMPCHDEDDHTDHWRGGMGGHMGGGMMGWY